METHLRQSDIGEIWIFICPTVPSQHRVAARNKIMHLEMCLSLVTILMAFLYLITVRHLEIKASTDQTAAAAKRTSTKVPSTSKIKTQATLISSNSNWQIKAQLKTFFSRIKIAFNRCNNKVRSNAERTSLKGKDSWTIKHIIQWTSKTNHFRNKMMGKTNQIIVWELQVTVRYKRISHTQIVIIKTTTKQKTLATKIRKQEDIQLPVQRMTEYQ